MYDQTMRGYRIATYQLVEKAREVIQTGPTERAVEEFAELERTLVAEIEDTLASDRISTDDTEKLSDLLDGLRDKETLMQGLLVLADRLENVEPNSASVVEV